MAASKELVEKYWLARIMFWRTRVGSLEDAASLQVSRVLRDAKATLLEEVAKAKLEGRSNSFTKHRKATLDWVDEVLASFKADTGRTISKAASATASRSLTEYADIMSVGGRAKAVQFVGLTPDQLDSWFGKWPLIGGTPVMDWVENAYGIGIRDSVAAAIQKAGVLGLGTRQAVNSVIRKAVEEGAQITDRAATTLTRTYIQSANVASMDAVMSRNRNLLKGWKWVTAFDSRVCPVCAGLDGRFYGLDEPAPSMPRHWRCRCLKDWVFKDYRELGLDLDEDAEDEMRTWVEREQGSIDKGGTRKILAVGQGRTFEDFYTQMSPAGKAGMLGPMRAKLLAGGKIEWNDLVDGTTGELRTLAELGFDKRGVAIPGFVRKAVAVAVPAPAPVLGVMDAGFVATTREEAEEMLLKRVGFTGMEPGTASLSDECVVKLANTLAKLEDEFGAIHKCEAMSLRYKAENGNTYASISFNWGSIAREYFNIYRLTEELLAKGTLAKKYREEMDGNWSIPVSKENLDVGNFIHEYGHIVHNAMTIKAIKATPGMGWQDIKKTCQTLISKAKATIIKKAMALSGKDKSAILGMMSKYGKQKPAEFFAEAFCNAMGGARNAIGEAMHEFLREVMKQGKI